MNTETAHRIRDRIRKLPSEIRVLCPRGHFIAHVGLYVPEFGPDPANNPVWMEPRGPGKEYVGDFSAGHHGFNLDLDAPTKVMKVGLVCGNKRCSYSGTFVFDILAVDLATAALNGHAEYRLTV